MPLPARSAWRAAGPARSPSTCSSFPGPPASRRRSRSSDAGRRQRPAVHRRAGRPHPHLAERRAARDTVPHHPGRQDLLLRRARIARARLPPRLRHQRLLLRQLHRARTGRSTVVSQRRLLRPEHGDRPLPGAVQGIRPAAIPTSPTTRPRSGCCASTSPTPTTTAAISTSAPTATSTSRAATAARAATPTTSDRTSRRCSARSCASTSTPRRRRGTDCAASSLRPMPRRRATPISAPRCRAATRSGTSACATRSASASIARTETSSSATSARNSREEIDFRAVRRGRRRQLGLALLRGQQPAQHQRLRPDRQLSLPHPRLRARLRPLLGRPAAIAIAAASTGTWPASTCSPTTAPARSGA